MYATSRNLRLWIENKFHLQVLTSLSTVSKKIILPFVRKFSRETNVGRRYDLVEITKKQWRIFEKELLQ